MTEFLNGVYIFLAYLAIAGTIVFSARVFTKIPDELFRKILHFILLGAYIPLLFGFKVWWHGLVFVSGLGVLLFPVLLLAGKIKGFSSFVNERKKGEFKSSMVLALGIMAVSIIVGWGLLDDKLVALAAVYSWGVGDAFAALIGKKYGKHKIMWKFVDNKKSYEGSAAMIVSSALAVFIVLLIRGGLNSFAALYISLAAATASTFVELCSKNGVDTITCPIVSMAVILPLIMAFGG